MRVGLIKNSKCDNIVIVNDIESAHTIFGEKYSIYECPHNYGIGDLCYDGTWLVGASQLIKVCPKCSNNVQASLSSCPICNYEFAG